MFKFIFELHFMGIVNQALNTGIAIAVFIACFFLNKIFSIITLIYIAHILTKERFADCKIVTVNCDNKRCIVQRFRKYIFTIRKKTFRCFCGSASYFNFFNFWCAFCVSCLNSPANFTCRRCRFWYISSKNRTMKCTGDF